MSVEELQLRRIVVSASGLIYWAGVFVQARRVRRHIGHSPNLKPRGWKEKLLWLGWFLVVAAWIGQAWLVGREARLAAFDLLPALLHPAVLALGLALIVLGYAGTLWAYAAMGDTWRIGISNKDTTALVNDGPFRWVRHPIYALQIVMLVGTALLLPTPVSFAVVATHYICVLIKAADEEKHLSTVHGDTYRDYSSRTGRLFPKITRR